MGKAITGAVELAGAIGMGALAFFDPAVLALPFYAQMMGSLALGGLSMEAGAIASAITGNRGQNITTRQPASYRQIVYGAQRIGGSLVFSSTTGSHHNQYNRVIVLATHQLSAITGLYLDGRLVYWIPGRSGYTTYGNSDFGGDCDGRDHTGPDGSTYNFGENGIYCEARFGNQSAGDVIGGLTANDPAWTANSHGSPYVGGCAYVYLKIEYNQSQFPSDPEIRFSVLGKPIYDPRTGQTAYSHNPALILNDVLTDPHYGLGDVTVNQAQLIAAANICEEQVPLAAGGTEDRYACHWHYDTSTGVGDVLKTVLDTMGGRLCRIGGEWYIYPAAYITPALSLGADQLAGPVQWSSTRSYRELFNEVRGTYTAPNFPYNIAGNYYDANGFADGAIQNNYGYAFQPTNYPAYACDVDHGYASNEYLTEDGGVLLTKELGLPGVLSIAQAQRLAKIALLRNRYQGTGTLQISLAAYRLAPCDTFLMNFAQQGWADKVLEVNSTQFVLENGGDGQPPKITFTVGVNETSPSVYEWSTTEEQTVYDAPALMSQAPYIPAPPTNMALISSAATALLQPDGTVVPRIEVTWDTPLDVLVTQIQVQYQVTTAVAWTDAGSVPASSNTAYISTVISGQTYNVRIRSLRANGATSVWVLLGGFTAGLVLSVQTQDGIGIGSLVGEAYSDGTAGIDCLPFSALLGGRTVGYFPAGPKVITGLVQQTLYYVYLLDATLGGGDLTPHATLDRTDYLGKLGYFFVDSIVTPYAATSGGSGGTGARYTPSSFQDYGTRTTLNPQCAYDGDGSTTAVISGSTTRTTTTYGDCLFQGDPAIGLPAITTLTVVAAVSCFGYPGSTAEITAIINGSATTLMSVSATTAQASYTCPIPANTPLSTISVEVLAQPAVVPLDDEPQPEPGAGEPIGDPTTTYHPSSVTVAVSEVYIQA